MTEQELRNNVVAIAEGWLGAKQGGAVHKGIIDTYNANRPSGGYKMTYSDPWCATFVSAVAIAAGLTGIMPVECSCSRMIACYQKLGRWMENDAHTPRTGDVIMYDWDDNGAGDCTGLPEHVGIVLGVSGGFIKIIEGNKNKSVGYRTIPVNGRYIRGYCLPDYASKVSAPASSGIASAVYVVKKGDTLSKIAASHGTTAYVLSTLNGIANADAISVGQVVFLTEAAAAIGKLAKLGVIGNPDYWQRAVAEDKVPYLEALLVKAARKIPKAGTPSPTVEKAVEAMFSAGVMNAPGYWLDNQNSYRGLGTLLRALGGSVKK